MKLKRVNTQEIAGGLKSISVLVLNGQSKTWIALFLIMSIAVALRLYGINWDQGALFHPDERAILMKTHDLEFPGPSKLIDLLKANESTWNPEWFNYGSFPLYTLYFMKAVASPFSNWDLFDLRIPGRVISALSDTVTVGLIFLIGRCWFTTRIGLLAALFSALAVLGIQLSHFFAVDTILVLLITATVFFAVKTSHSGEMRDSALGGLFLGLAIATKASAIVLVIPVLTAHLIFLISSDGDSFRFPNPISEKLNAKLEIVLRRLAMLIGICFITLLITQPYMFLDFDTYKTDISDESAMVRRDVDLPYTRQYIETTRYFYQAWQLSTYGLGPVLGALTLVGLGSAVILACRHRKKTDLVILGWLIPYLLITGWFEVKFLRYMLPALPFLLLYGARVAWWAFDWTKKWRRPFGYMAPLVIGFLVVTTGHYAISYEMIYSRPHPAQEASNWLRNNAQQGSLILKEHWEEGLPDLPKMSTEELHLYDPDSKSKFTKIAAQLSNGDFLVFYSKRLYATLPRLPERYPSSTEYYRRIFDGSLGYKLVHVSDSVPGVFGLNYDEDPFARTEIGSPTGYTTKSGGIATVDFGWADESFSVYDHPKTLIFKNVQRLTPEEIFELVWNDPVIDRSPGLMFNTHDWETQTNGGTYKNITRFSRQSDRYSWLVWLIAVEVIGLITLPLGFILFRPLAGRGYLLNKTLGLLLVSFAAWIMASSGIMDFSRISVVVGILIIAAISTITTWRYRSEFLSFLRRNIRSMIWMELLFLATFFAFLAIRVANPDLWHPFRGGEKPMDFAYLNAVTKSTVMPPYDPWFSGGFLNYYYFGQFIIASLIRLTGIAPSISFNLAIPLLFALTAGGAFSIVYALVEGTKRIMGRKFSSTRGSVFAGLFAIFLVVVSGNIDGLLQVAEGIGRVIFDGGAYGTFDYWRSSRMFAANSTGHEITEFPFFTFLFADLHAHTIAIPFTLLAIGLTSSIFLRAFEHKNQNFVQWVGIITLGLVVGGLRVINAWDYPMYLILAICGIVGGEIFGNHGTKQTRLGRALIFSIVVVAISHLAYLPFHQNFQLFSDGFIHSATQTPLWRYWAIHSSFLFLILSYVVWQGRGVTGIVIAKLVAHSKWLLLGPFIIGVLVGVLCVAGYWTVAFTLLTLMTITTLAIIGVSTQGSRARFDLIALALVIGAFAIGAGVDIVTVKNDIGRLNTVFKFYLQAWVMFGLGSAYIAWRLFDSGVFSFRNLSLLRGTWLACASFIAVGIIIYPILGTHARVRDRFNTDHSGIDGTTFMEHATHFEKSEPIQLKYDLDAIRWLQENITGSPTIVEGLTDLYHWGNRVSIYTGLPTIVGWDWHQRQQRVEYAWAVTKRRHDVDRIYKTSDADVAIAIMREYGARYLFIGELERLYYPEAGISKFEKIQDQGLIPVYSNDQVIIYELTSPHGSS